MSAEILKWVYWLIATVGIAGAIALWLLFPPIFTMVFTLIARLFALVLRSRIGCAVLAAIAAGLIINYHRAALDAAEWKRQMEAFRQEQEARDAKIASETREAVWKEIADATAANAETTTEVKNYETQLKPLAANDPTCRVESDVDKLRAISGSAGRKPASVKRMRSPRWPRRAS
jgi:uncharacterized membrane protein YraQ (UPF0718 family)